MYIKHIKTIQQPNCPRTMSAGAAKIVLTSFIMTFVLGSFIVLLLFALDMFPQRAALYPNRNKRKPTPRMYANQTLAASSPSRINVKKIIKPLNQYFLGPGYLVSEFFGDRSFTLNDETTGQNATFTHDSSTSSQYTTSTPIALNTTDTVTGIFNYVNGKQLINAYESVLSTTSSGSLIEPVFRTGSSY